MKILLIEDDKRIASLVCLYLQKEHYSVSIASDGEEGVKLFHQIKPDFVVLDLMLPILDGWSVLKAIRQAHSTPVILLTAKSDDIDKILGLETGADDYITKPFNPRELIARIRSITRRLSPSETKKERKININNLVIDPDKMEVIQDGAKLHFSALEFKLLFFMASRPGQVFSRSRLLEKIYADQDILVEERTIDVHIKNIRKKLGDSSKSPVYIESVFSVGYRFVEP